MKTQRHSLSWSPDQVYSCRHSSTYTLIDYGVPREFCMACGTLLQIHAASTPQRPSLVERIGSQIQNLLSRFRRRPVKLSLTHRAFLAEARTGVPAAQALDILQTEGE